MTQVLYVLQGVPGSGKSHLANLIATGIPDCVICSTDSFFTVDGVYLFDPGMLATWHKASQRRARIALSHGRTVVVDNTNIRRWECKPYVTFAVERGIPIVFIRVNGPWQTTHGVPPERIEAMRLAMEDLTVESVLASEPPKPKGES